MPPSFTGQIKPGQAVQFGVNDGGQTIQRGCIARAPGLEHPGQFDGGEPGCLHDRILACSASGSKSCKKRVVLMDIRMDEMDGIQATERIKAADQGARILIVTDYDDEELRRAAMRAGAWGYVLKKNLLALVQLLEAME